MTDIRKSLMGAIREQDSNLVRRLITENPAVLEADWIGRTVLVAAEKGDLATLSELHQLGIDLNVRSRLRGNPIYRAARDAHSETIRWLHRHGVPIEGSDFDTDPLIQAAFDGHVDVVRTLLELGANPHHVYTLQECSKSARSVAEDEGQTAILQIIDQSRRTESSEVGVTPSPDSPADDDSERQAYRKEIATLISGQFRGNKFLRLKTRKVYDIYVIRSDDTYPFQTMFTIGLADKNVHAVSAAQSPKRVELMMHFPLSWDLKDAAFKSNKYRWPFDQFSEIADGIASRDLNIAHDQTIISLEDPPQPLGEGTELCCLLLLADFYDFSPIISKSDAPVHFYNFVPLYREERDFEQAHGIVALLDSMSQKTGSLIVRRQRERFV